MPEEAAGALVALLPIKDAVRAFVRWQHDFCGRGDEWKTCFEELRDAMGLSDDYSPGAEGGGACCDL